MSKLTLTQRIEKLNENILKEEILIEGAKEKIKKFKVEIKELQEEKNQTYGSDFLKILAENGLTTDEQKNEFMKKIQEQIKINSEKFTQ